MADFTSESSLVHVATGTRAYVWITFDDVTAIASKVAIRNDTPGTCRYSIYQHPNYATPYFTYEVGPAEPGQPGVLQEWNLAPGQRYNVDDYGISMQVLGA